ncbi:hypothetical protein MLD38_000742 [Melastoma candidum]|uniref:Uncharacterized protein n=1 Tax=Melastoma candidum TaxID=119954 RepID=A0ACB9SBZ0_9MYRT|nr:hypothetical protein MLD38_000742 [Melastoma candidum]
MGTLIELIQLFHSVFWGISRKEFGPTTHLRWPLNRTHPTLPFRAPAEKRKRRLKHPQTSIISCSWAGVPSTVTAMGRTFSRCPVTFDADTSPFQRRPEDLSKHIWYLLRSEHNRDKEEEGSWKPIGEPRNVTFMGLPLICKETISVFREGDDQETDWVMLQYKITTDKETVSICRTKKGPTNHVDPDPFPLEDIQHRAHNCPFLAAGIQYASSIFAGGDFLELLDLD